MSSQRTALHTWLQLLRAPNLFTVPGDPLAGFLIASGGVFDWHALATILASLCFYGYGLLLNDLSDIEEDRRDRPSRPLPSGAASIRTVRLVAAILAGAGLLACATGPRTLVLGLILLATISPYNLWSKKTAGLGPLNMGLCRGLSFLLGVSAGLPGKSHWVSSTPLPSLTALITIGAGGLTLYIALVTNLARIETQAQPAQSPRALPFPGILAVVLPLFCFAIDPAHPFEPFNIALYAVSAYTIYAGFKIHRKLTHQPAPPIPPMIGQLIRLLLPLQAIWCLAARSAAGVIAATILLVLWPISRNVSKRFYAS